MIRSTSNHLTVELMLGWMLCAAIAASAISWHRNSPEIYAQSPSRLFYKNPRNVPSDLCPRDEAQAQLQGRTCLRKCTNDEDCKSKRKKCMCDGACGLSCVKPERECNDPESPLELGEVHANGKFFGSKATYSCPDGFKVIGMEERVCQADGSWSGTAPSCQKNTFCTSPPIIEHARHNGPLDQKTFDLDFSLQYQCLPGYITKGFARTKCFLYNGTAKWFGPDITCEPKSCGEPQDILNGRREGECVHVGCEMTYVCQPGFDLVGRQKHTCQSDGTWTPKDLPTCVPVQCPIPENPGNGNVEYSSLSFNSVITYKCKYGYMLVGDGTRRCGPNKRWSGSDIQCKEINCGSPGILPNGWLEGTRTTLHAVVIFHCQPTMTFEGTSDRSVCTSDNTWSHSTMPKCLAPCKVPIIPFGNVTMKDESEPTLPPPTTAPLPPDSTNLTTVPPIKEIILKPGTTIAHGKSIGVKCETHYEASHLISPPACHNGSWSHAPKCQPARCKNLPKAPRHGMVIAPKTEHGMKARFTCRDGYVLLGNNVTECQYGNWVGEPPVCNQTFCKFPGVIPNGRVLLVGNMGLYDYRNYVTKVANNRQIMFDCEKGYVLADGPPGKTCIKAEWSPKAETPRCIASQHPNFRWVRSVRSARSIRRKRKAGAKQAGSAAMRNKQFGGRGGDGGGKRGSRKHHKVEGEDEDDYEEAPSVCSGLDHDPYIQKETIQAGEDINQTYSHGSVVRVSCTHGFGVNLPNETIKCVQGRWKPKLPQCSALPCKVPYLIHGTFYEKTKGLVFMDLIKHGIAIELKCTKGYALRGPSKLVCWYGEFDVGDPSPECVPAPCKLPSLNYGTYEKGYRSGMHVTHGTEMDYTCDGDFRKISAGTTTCILGDFRPSRPACFHPSNMGNNTLHGGYNEYNVDNGDKKNKKLDKETMKNVYNGIKRACGSPPRERGAVSFVEGRPVDYSMDFSFPDGIDIQYRCINVKPKVKNRWRVACNDGVWTTNANHTSCEPANGTEFDIDELLQMINGSCKYKNLDKYVATFFTDRQVGSGDAEFPTGTVLTSRCVDIGKFRLKGSVRRRCVSGQWLGITPKCEGLSQFYDYALGKPPTILFRYENGSIIQSNDGKLLIFEGTTLHMECLWIRKFGTPKWETSNTHREYQEGWAELPGRNRDLEYRLTIDNAQIEDSGTYRCSTPARYTHEVNIEVTKTHCSPLPESSALIYSTNSSALGAVVSFECQGGNSVVGAQELTCLPSANWSGVLPKCENVECQDISLLPAMAPMAYPSRNSTYKKNETAPPKISIVSLDVGGKALFTCPQGYVADGAADATCQSNGKWSNPLPICKEVECPNPSPPDNGFVTGKPPYKAGDLAQFECHPNYMMEGQPIIACQDNGKWSRAVGIKCVVSCHYPGTTIGGTISKVKFYYAIGETVEFDCTDEYELHGTRMLHCQKNGKWSNTVPTCAVKNGNAYRRVIESDEGKNPVSK
ncbi:sushi, von Willebrand factor type A, EGF and pentraxin domain-containing protein 1 isoform X2 [Folsomia candida]|uniref:sushi, von Willebrand factor type A, EGF and pentraxin domain-containing protein 1 isoform X2 n=1 Tax=Folsomia candida TaxID=158441 RepID=UPI000B907148|nr:sushi, von Willebrand factor type A, EGF and pentraxin domain-containing protein 1 isoform X2 [Folsomia candida]